MIKAQLNEITQLLRRNLTWEEAAEVAHFGMKHPARIAALLNARRDFDEPKSEREFALWFLDGCRAAGNAGQA